MTPANLCALIVEDDRSWQQILQEILMDAGLAVDLADNLDEAVTRLRETPHRLAVVDLSLKNSDHHNKDGLAVLDAINRLDPGCVTVLLTGFATVELAVSALSEHGAFTCLRKEAFNRAEFREIVRRALASLPATILPAGTLEQPAPVKPGPDEPLKTRQLAALVVEDDAGWRSILSELLVDTSFQVRLCNSYGEALGYLRRESFALAVVDLSLVNSGAGKPQSVQELDGYKLLANIRAGGIPTIVVSGNSNPQDIDRVYVEQDIFAYLEKQTFDRRAFLKAVEDATASKTLSPELERLTDREREVLVLLASGKTNKEIAEILFITTNTVKRHLKAVFTKLDIHTRSAAASKAIGLGMVVDRTIEIKDVDQA